MKNVVDQGYLREPALRTYLTAAADNGAIVTDMAIFEMLKGQKPIYSAQRSLEIISDFPEQVFCTGGTGDLMRWELDHRKPIESPIDKDLTDRMRHLLRQVAKSRADASVKFPLDEAHVLKERGAAMQQRLDHGFHKGMLDGGVAVLREKLPAELQSEIRSNNLTNDVFEFVEGTSLIAFRDAIAELNVPEEDVERLFRERCLGSRVTRAYTIASMRWYALGGPEAMAAEKVTNDFHDLDYVTHATYFDGVFSNDRRVKAVSARVKEFFEYG